MLLEFAGIVIDVKNKHKYFEELCREFEVSDKKALSQINFKAESFFADSAFYLE